MPGYRRGSGWYRKRLRLDPELRGKRIFIYFEGANQVADLYVNGHHAGQHIGGYTAFVFDVTEGINWDRDNLLAVTVDNSHSQDIPPLNADFTFYGGIYRDVWLVATEPIHVTLRDHASPGVFIDTPSVSAESASARFTATIVNLSPRSARVRVVSRVFDAHQREVTSISSAAGIEAGGSRQFQQQTGVISRPHLWSPEDPYLYRVKTEVYEGARLVDVVESPLGFRWFRADAQQGFFLNGKPLRLVGTNRHQDYARLGNAVPDELHRRDVRLIKENGFNFLRLAHYPQDPAILEETDRRGLVVWEEIPIVNLISMSPDFAANSERMLTEMIRQHYNHPSIFFWGYMNEVLLTKPSPIPPGYYEAVVALTRRLEAGAETEDRTRATVMALSRDEIHDDKGIGDIPDILGLNLYFGWYYEQLDSLGPFLDRLHRERPNRPLIVSEYGADSDERVHARNPVAFDFSSEYPQRFHMASFAQIEARDYLIGSAVWNQFDFGSELRHDTKHALNQKGLFYFDRTPKDTAFYYQAALLRRPMLYIAREWSTRAGSRPDDRTSPVWVYTNLDEVELLVNGRSAGVREVRNRTAEWSIEFSNGVNDIRARGRRGEQRIEDHLQIHYIDRTDQFSANGVPGIVVAVNAGGAYSYVDPAGVVWEADRPYEPGSWGFLGGEPGGTHHRVFSTPDDPLFQVSREGMQAYRFDVPEGLYEISLGLVEWKQEKRVFSVTVNGQRVLADVDLAADYGIFTAATRSVRVPATSSISIEFTAKAGSAAISAILIRRIF